LARRTILLVATLAAVGIAGYVARTHSHVPPGQAAAGEDAAASPAPISRPLHRERRAVAQLGSVELARKTMEFEALKQRAKHGDAAAQRELALTYEKCVEANYRQDEFVTLYEWKSQHTRDPSQAAARMRTARERATVCKSVDGGAVVPGELIAGWLEQAAKNGDLAAQARVAAFTGRSFDEEEANQFIERVVKSNDPAAMFMMGILAGGRALEATGQKYNHVVSSSIDTDAWMAVACRMGYDCSPSGDVMGTLCLDTGICERDLEDFLRSGFKSDKEMQEFDRKVAEISRLVQEE